MTDSMSLSAKIESLIVKAAETHDANDAMKFAQAATNAGQAMCMLRDVRASDKGLTIDDQIKYMVDRFLQWRLPENFNPDNGISFDPIVNAGNQYESRRTPTGTNLFDATQATKMVRFLIDGLPD